MNEQKVGLVYLLTHDSATGLRLPVTQILLRLGILVVVVIGLIAALFMSFVQPEQRLKFEDLPDGDVSIAVVEDDAAIGRFMEDFAEIGYARTGRVDLYTVCQDLLNAMGSGKRYQVYFIDTETKFIGAHNGYDCAAAVRQLHPDAYIIANSAGDYEGKWEKTGLADEFADKAQLKNVLERILGKR